jgi:hypothetical protein
MRNFVVAAWREERRRQRELHQVKAETGEHAIHQVAASRSGEEQSAVYEAWPLNEPEKHLTMTLVRRGE